MKDKQNNLKNFTRGGQIWLNNFRMFNQVSGQLFSWVFWPVLIAGIAIGFYCLGLEKVFFFMKYYEAKTGIGLARILNPDQIQQKIMVFSYMGQEYQARYLDFVSNAYVINAVREVWMVLIGVLIGTIGVTVSGIILSSTLFERRGAEQNETKLIRGSKIASVKEVAKYLVSKNNASTHTIECIRNPEAVESLLKDFNPDNQALYDKRVKVVNLPLTHNFEVRHVLIHGTTGSGKTQLIRSLLREIRKRGDKVILTDKGPVLAGEFFDASLDLMLNPFDERCAYWDLWREALTGPDFDNLAESLIPSAAGSDDPFWTNAARTIFASAAYTMQDDPKRSIEKLLRLLLTAEFSELQKYLSKTQAATLASKDIEKTALSIKAVLANHLKSLRFMKGLSRDKNGNKRPGFAIRDWILDEKNRGWLFITSNANQHASLRSLISMWLSMASISLLSLPPDSKRRIWIIMDELPSLHKLPQLPETMAQVRKYGGCFVLGMQSFVQLQKIYGDTAAKEMFDLLNTRFYFRNPSNEVARIISKDLGEEEVEILNENYSMGANSIRDGISVGKQRVVRPLVMPTDIMQLRDLQFYLKMAGDMPIVKTDLKLTVSQEIHPGFIARDMPSDKTLDEVIVVAEAATYARKVKSSDADNDDVRQLQDEDQDLNQPINIDQFVEIPESNIDEGNPLLSSAFQESEIVSDSADHAKSHSHDGIGI